MALVLYGFPTQVQALQFEWAWQHPAKSKAVRSTAASIGRSGQQGVKGKIRLMLAMLHLSPWKFYPLTLQFLSSSYAAHMSSPGMMATPSHIQVLVAPMEDLPSCIHDEDDHEEEERQMTEQEGASEGDDGPSTGGSSSDSSSSSGRSSSRGSPETDTGSNSKVKSKRQPKAKAACCALCDLEVVKKQEMSCSCGCSYHMDCLAGVWIALVHEERISLSQGQPSSSSSLSLTREASHGEGQRVPNEGLCPSCQKKLSWISLLQAMTSEGWGKKRGRRRAKVVRATRKKDQTTLAAAEPLEETKAGKAKRGGSKKKAEDTTLPLPKPSRPLLIEIGSTSSSSTSPQLQSPTSSPPVVPLAQRLAGRAKKQPPPVSVDVFEDLDGLMINSQSADQPAVSEGKKKARSRRKASSREIVEAPHDYIDLAASD